jgi:hypothetical protein
MASEDLRDEHHADAGQPDPDTPPKEGWKQFAIAFGIAFLIAFAWMIGFPWLLRGLKALAASFSQP